MTKVMTNVYIVTLRSSEVIYQLPGMTGLQYVHPGHYGLLKRLGLQEGLTYEVQQEVVGTFGGKTGRPIYEWVDAVDQHPKKEAPFRPANKLLEF